MRAKRRLDVGYVDVVVEDLDEALRLVKEAQEQDIGRSIGLIGNAADIYPELVKRGITPDVVTDQTPAHDVMMYVPIGLNVEQAEELRKRNQTPHSIKNALCSPWLNMWKPCWKCKKEARKSLITATICANGLLIQV